MTGVVTGVATGVASGVASGVALGVALGVARCLNRGNWTLRVRKRCFWVISTPSSGLNGQKNAFFCVFLNRKTFPVTVSCPERLESQVRCLNMGNWTLRVRKRCFWVISTPSSGLKWQKKNFFRVFLNRNSSEHFWLEFWKQKMFGHDI